VRHLAFCLWRHAARGNGCKRPRSVSPPPEDRTEIDRLLPPGFAAGDRNGDDQLLAIERYC
jgi:hypothetical protein